MKYARLWDAFLNGETDEEPVDWRTYRIENGADPEEVYPKPGTPQWEVHQVLVRQREERVRQRRKAELIRENVRGDHR